MSNTTTRFEVRSSIIDIRLHTLRKQWISTPRVNMTLKYTDLVSCVIFEHSQWNRRVGLHAFLHVDQVYLKSHEAGVLLVLCNMTRRWYFFEITRHICHFPIANGSLFISLSLSLSLSPCHPPLYPFLSVCVKSCVMLLKWSRRFFYTSSAVIYPGARCLHLVDASLPDRKHFIFLDLYIYTLLLNDFNSSPGYRVPM